MDNENIYTETQVFNVLTALQQGVGAVPWWLRWVMKGYTVALQAVTAALCPNVAGAVRSEEVWRQAISEE